jgi:hypothetical protein
LSWLNDLREENKEKAEAMAEKAKKACAESK